MAASCQVKEAESQNVTFVKLVKKSRQTFSLTPQVPQLLQWETTTLGLLLAVTPKFLLQTGPGFQPLCSPLHFTSSFYLI